MHVNVKLSKRERGLVAEAIAYWLAECYDGESDSTLEASSRYALRRCREGEGEHELLSSSHVAAVINALDEYVNESGGAHVEEARKLHERLHDARVEI